MLTGSTMPQDEGGCQGAYHYLRRRPTPTIATVTIVTSEFPVSRDNRSAWTAPSGPPQPCLAKMAPDLARQRLSKSPFLTPLRNSCHSSPLSVM